MGAPENVRLVELGPGRGTMMLDALRARAHRAGFPQGGGRAHGRDQPHARAAAAAGAGRDRCSGRLASIARRGAGRPDHHHRQRVHRRAAGASGGDVRRRLARARDQDRRQRQPAVQPRPRSDPAVRPDAAAAAAQRADRRDLRVARGPDRARDRPPRRAFARRRADHRLRPYRKRRRRHLPGGRPADLHQPAAVARAPSISPPMSISRRWRMPRKRSAPTSTVRSTRPRSCAGSASRPAPRRSRRARRSARTPRSTAR